MAKSGSPCHICPAHTVLTVILGVVVGTIVPLAGVSVVDPIRRSAYVGGIGSGLFMV